MNIESEYTGLVSRFQTLSTLQNSDLTSGKTVSSQLETQKQASTGILKQAISAPQQILKLITGSTVDIYA